VAVSWLVSAAMRLLNAKIKISPCEEALAEGFSIRFYTKEKEGVEVDRGFFGNTIMSRELFIKINYLPSARRS